MRAIVTVTFDQAVVDALYYAEPTGMTLEEWRRDWAEGVTSDMCASDSRASYEVVYEP